jgi:hypothetical protein
VLCVCVCAYVCGVCVWGGLYSSQNNEKRLIQETKDATKTDKKYHQEGNSIVVMFCFVLLCVGVGVGVGVGVCVGVCGMFML